MGYGPRTTAHRPPPPDDIDPAVRSEWPHRCPFLLPGQASAEPPMKPKRAAALKTAGQRVGRPARADDKKRCRTKLAPPLANLSTDSGGADPGAIS